MQSFRSSYFYYDGSKTSYTVALSPSNALLMIAKEAYDIMGTSVIWKSGYECLSRLSLYFLPENETTVPYKGVYLFYYEDDGEDYMSLCAAGERHIRVTFRTGDLLLNFDTSRERLLYVILPLLLSMREGRFQEYSIVLPGQYLSWEGDGGCHYNEFILHGGEDAYLYSSTGGSTLNRNQLILFTETLISIVSHSP